MEENWALFEASGYADPNVEQPEPLCTWCEDNTLSDSTTDRAIDHILLRNAAGTDVFRFLDGTVDIEFDGETVSTSYSDHYGLGASISPVF